MLRIGWYKITKSVRGSGYVWAFYVNRKTANQYLAEDDILKEIGDNTSGGRDDGYHIKSRYCGMKKPRNTDLLYLKKITILVWRTRPGEYSYNREKQHKRAMEKIGRENRRRAGM